MPLHSSLGNKSETPSQNKRNEVLIFAITEMNLENIMRSESQSQKTTYGLIPLIRNVQNRQIGQDRKQTGDCLGAEGSRDGKQLLIATGFFGGMMKLFWNLKVVMVM